MKKVLMVLGFVVLLSTQTFCNSVNVEELMQKKVIISEKLTKKVFLEQIKKEQDDNMLKEMSKQVIPNTFISPVGVYQVN